MNSTIILKKVKDTSQSFKQAGDASDYLSTDYI